MEAPFAKKKNKKDKIVVIIENVGYNIRKYKFK